MNIAGVIVFAKPESNSKIELQARLNALQGVEVHAMSDEGKIVVTIENERESGLADSLMEMQNLKGVLSASMVYHHNENNVIGAAS